MGKYGGKILSSINSIEFKPIPGDFHGDEGEIAAEARRCAEEFEAEHADDWKYSDERLGYEHE